MNVQDLGLATPTFYTGVTALTSQMDLRMIHGAPMVHLSQKNARTLEVSHNMLTNSSQAEFQERLRRLLRYLAGDTLVLTPHLMITTPS